MTEVCLMCERDPAEWHIVAGCLNKHIWDAKRCMLCKIQFQSNVAKRLIRCLVLNCGLKVDMVIAEKLYQNVTF